MKYKNVGAHPEDTAEGAMLAPGEVIDTETFDVEAEHNKRLIGEGIFIEVGEDTQPEATEAAIEAAAVAGVALTAVTGTGTNGQITKPDVDRHVAEASREEA